MKIEYNTELKSWKSLNYPHFEFVKHFIGEIFLDNFKNVNNKKIIELHYDTGVTKNMALLYREALTVAINFQRLGVKKGDVVVIYSMVNSKVSCLTMGALMLGAVVNFFETTFQTDYAKYTFKLLSPTVLLYEEKYKLAILEVLKELKLPLLKHQISIDGNTGITIDNVLFKSVSSDVITNFILPKLGDPQEITAFLLFTSGSTGLPKAVALSHAQILHGVISFWSQPNGSTILTPDSVIFSLSPLRWISQVLLMLQSLLMGIKRVYASGFPSGEYGREIVSQSDVTHFFSPLGYYKIDNSNDYSSDGFLNTGDYGFMDDNNALHIMARFKDLVRTKTVILIPSEVEKLICTIPTVFAAVLVGYRSLTTDIVDKAALYIVKHSQNIKLDEQCQQGQDQDEMLRDEVRNLLQNHLKPSESCIIRLVNIIDKFPLTSCGKVDKPALMQLAKTLDVQ